MARITRRCALLLAGAACALLLQPRAYAFRKDSVPEWVRDAAKEAVPAYHNDPDAVILLDDNDYTVRPDGHAVLHERIVRRILRPQGRAEANFVVGYNKDSKVDWMHVWSIGADGHEYEVKDNEIVDIADVSEQNYILYADDRNRIGHAPAGDPGAVVAMEYQEEMPNYRPEVQWAMNGSLPIHRNQITVQLPPGFQFDTRWKQSEPIKPMDLGNNRWQWTLLDAPALDMKDVKLAPVGGELLSMMTLHYAGPGTAVPEDWQSIGVWYQGLTADRTQATPEMTAKAQALTAGLTDFYARAQAIDAFVRGDIRYIAVEVGIGGFQPHAAQDIFRNRYGDCKDKATLLAAMLNAVGIHSTWLMVDTEHSIDPAMPSLLGDHMVAAIELPPGYNSPSMYSVVTASSGKRFLITDPTWEKTPFGQIEHELQGSYALLVDGAQSQVIQIPVMAPERNLWTRSAQLKLGDDGTLSGDVVEHLYGDDAAQFRSAFIARDEHEQKEMIERYVNNEQTEFQLAKMKTENLREVDKEFVLSYSVSTGAYARSVGPLIMLRPRVLGSDAIALDEKPRAYPVNLTEAMVEKDDFTIELPASYVVDEVPDPVKVNMSFASYESKTAVQGNMLHYTRTYTVRSVEVPAKNYSDLQELEGSIVSDERSNVLLRKTQ
jgi:hypothetical protein